VLSKLEIKKITVAVSALNIGNCSSVGASLLQQLSIKHPLTNICSNIHAYCKVPTQSHSEDTVS